ncbi:MAG: UvrD-helicase domain-containing protein, partial [Candidatus Symbiothrix sp.]|nr:UvrD-helicase domain-containing protein [Candidatus Symbiothrix sp.]
MTTSASNFFVYRASAGSGKTYTIALQYIRQLLRGVSHRQILAVT